MVRTCKRPRQKLRFRFRLKFILLFMLLMEINPGQASGRKGRHNIIQELKILDEFRDVFSPLATLLACLDEPKILQATLFPPVDILSARGPAGILHDAQIPVVIESFDSPPGYLYIAVVKNQRYYSERFASNLMMSRGTNVFGIFIFVYVNCNEFTISAVQKMHEAMHLRLGRVRIIHLLITDDPSVQFVLTSYSEKKPRHFKQQDLCDFCKEQSEKRNRNLQLSADIKQLKGIRYAFMLPEHSAWIDKIGREHFGGREAMLWKLVQKLGMQWILMQRNSTLSAEVAYKNVEIGLAVANLAFFGSTNNFVEYSVAVKQIGDYLVVRVPHRIPYTLVLLLPFQWTPWSCLGATLVLFVLTWTLVRYRRLQISSVYFAVFDVIEMILTGNYSRSISWFTQRLEVMCIILLYVIAGNAYTGLLLGFLTVPRYFKELNTINDVLAAVDRLYVSEIYFYEIYNGNEERLRKLQGNLIGIRHIADRDISVRDIIETGRAATSMSENIYKVTSRYRKYTDNGRIMLHKVKEPLRSISFGVYLVRRNHFVLHVFNTLILRLWESGLFSQWDRMLSYSLDLDGQRVMGESEEPEKLRPDQLTGPFLLLGGGLVLAGIAFLLELLVGREWIPIARIFFYRIKSAFTT